MVMGFDKKRISMLPRVNEGHGGLGSAFSNLPVIFDKFSR
jgi:hypothetical protein